MSPYSFNREALNKRLINAIEKYRDLPEDAEITLKKSELLNLAIATSAGAVLAGVEELVQEAYETFEESLKELEGNA